MGLTLVRGKRRKDTVLICLSQDDIEEGKIAMNKGKIIAQVHAIYAYVVQSLEVTVLSS